MNERDKLLLCEFKSKLPLDLKKCLKQIIVFGSRVKGEAAEDSDLDVAVLVDNKTSAVEKQLEDAAYQVMWAHDFKPIISLKVFTFSRFNEAVSMGFSFYRRIQQEGIAV